MSRIWVIGWALAATSMAGCATPAMDVPVELGQAERLTVEGRGGLRQSRVMRFGEYAAVEIDRSWTRGSGMAAQSGNAGISTSDRRQRYTFELSDGPLSVGHVACAATASRGTLETAVVDVNASDQAGVECALTPLGEEVGGWELALLSKHGRHIEGALHAGAGAGHYAVVSTGPGGGIVPAWPKGFEIRRGERVVAAVETVSRGAVWLSPGLSDVERRTLAGAAAALLLYEPLSADD